MWVALDKKLADWDAYFARRMGEKEPEEFRQADQEWVEATLPQIEEEECAVSVRLQKLEELIAKTKMLIADVNKDLCRELTGGDDLMAVCTVLVEQFGDRIERDYAHGRKTLREALSEHYNLDAKSARELFALLEDAKVVRYGMERNPDTRVILPVYYPEAVAAMSYGGFYGEPQNAVAPPLRVFWDIG